MIAWTLTADRPDGASSSASAVVSSLFVFVLLIAFSTRVTSEAITPRFAVLLLAAAIAIPRLSAVLRSPQRAAALLGGGFVAVAAASAATSGSLVAVYGQYDWGTGLLFVVALFGCWVIGTSAGAVERRLLRAAVLAGCAVNLVVALLQVVVDLSAAGLGLFEGRAPGLLGNPVHLAALVTGALGLTAWMLLHERVEWVAGVFFASIGVQLSGSRFAIVIAVAGVAVAVFLHRSRRSMHLALTVLVGLAVGQLTMQTLPPRGEVATTALSRVTSAGADPHARIEGWKSAVDAVIADPVVGAGPGRFQPGIAPHGTLALAQASPHGYYIDAHNLVVEYAVTTGIPGVVLLLAWIFMSLRGASGPFLWFALGVLGIHLVQPQNVATTPIAFLALGAASKGAGCLTPRSSTAGVAAAVVAAAIALVIGGRVLIGDVLLAQATASRSSAAAIRADSWLPPWPQPARRVAQLYDYESDHGGGDQAGRQAIAWFRRAAERDPSRAYWWNTLAAYEADTGSPTAAQHDYRRALEADPWSVDALVGAARLEHADGNDTKAWDYLRRARKVAPTDPGVVELAAELSRPSARS